MDYKQTGLDILKLAGGAENVSKLTHCATRLRFEFNDKSKVNKEAIEKLSGVISVVDKGGQFQVVIGNEVQQAFRAIKNELGENTSVKQKKDDGDKESIVSRLISIISTTFTPVIPAITGAGMIKAVLALLTAFNLINAEGSTYQLLNMISDAAFYFMPVLLAYGASIKFECSPIMAMTLACVMVHPTWSGFVGANEAITFFGIPVVLADYASTVLPIIFSVWIMSYVESFAERISPSIIKFFTKPLLTLLITAPIALIIVGPIGVWLNDIVAAGAELINQRASWLIPFLMGALQPLLVVSGTAWAMTPIATMQITKMGSEMINGPGMLASNIAQGGATLAVAKKTKNKQLKQLAGSTGITAVLGITEPSLYGVTLRLKRPLIASMIGGGIAGFYAGVSGLVRYAFVSPGLAALPAFIGENPMNIVHAVITCIIAFTAAFAAAWIMGFEDPEESEDIKSEKNTEVKADKAVRTVNGNAGEKKEAIIYAPVDGEAITLDKVNDEVFSSNVLGRGAAIIPNKGKICAPADSTVSSIFPTKHAIGLTTADGLEVLIHIGLDTVNLEGKYFEAKVTEGQEVKTGEELIIFDMQAIKSEGYDLVTPVVITNSDDYSNIKLFTGENIKAGSKIITVDIS